MLRRLRIILAALLLAAGLLAAYGYHYYNAPGPLTQETTVLFPRGKGFQAIVDGMEEAGVIRHALLFKAIAVILGDARQFKAGEYRFSPAISPKLVMDMIAKGRVVVHKITIPEGLTVREITELLRAEPALEGDISGIFEEGSLLPDTFHYVYGDARSDIIARMRESMKTTLAELWEKRQEGLPLESPQQALILASLVEKETGIDAERPRVAAVFVNRLRKGMKLQCDPTVAYGIARDKGPLNRPLHSADLKYDSPYNTYLYVGLPPGPIANPGRKSIAAALNPPQTDDLYFVATGNGGHNFSPTLDGHNKNVREYRKARTKKPKR
jgi:UPF0755 protein